MGTSSGSDRAEERRSESEMLFQAVVETSPDAVGIIGIDGKVVALNQRAARMVGFDTVEQFLACGRNGFDYFPPDEQPRAMENLQRLIETGRLVDVEHTVIRADGSTFIVEINISLIRDSSGEPRHFIAVGRDITDRKRAEQELHERYAALAEAHRKLEALHRSKDELIATLSHELRTPLVSGLGYLELALEGRFGALPESAAERLGVSRRRLKQLSTLVDNIIGFHSSSLDELRSALDLVPVETSGLIDESAADLRIRSGRADLDLGVSVPGDCPSVMADESMLRRVLCNLLDNAVRHGGETSTIRLTAEATVEGKVRFSVSDDGAGIPDDIRERMFEPFAKLQSSGGGAGLGLSVVRSILEAHGAEVEIESVTGRGTTVTFELPAAG